MNGRCLSGALPAAPVAVEQGRAARLGDLLIPLLSGVVGLLVFTATLAPDLTWAHFGSDGGELITAATTLGIPHPPGYPTYVLLGKLFGLLPLGPPAWRFNLFSAVCAATATAFVTATARSTLAASTYRDAASVAAGLAVAFTPLLWSQAIISEVYTLNLAIVAVYLWSLLTRRPPLLSGLLGGLGITTHLTSLLLLPLALAQTPRRQWPPLFVGLAAGLLPLLLLPLLARSQSPVVWGDPVTLSGWWWLVTARLYAANIGLPAAGAVPARLVYVSLELLRQLAWIGWLLIALGLSAKIVGKDTAVWLLVTAVFYLLYTFLYRPDDAVVNLLPILILVSPLLAAGLAQIGPWSMLLPLGLLLLNYRAVNLVGERAVRPLAQAIFAEAPPDAVLITPGDQSIFTLWYFQHVEGSRDDLALVDANLLAFDWYRQRLQRLEPGLVALDEDNPELFRAQNGRVRPVCDVPPALSGPLRCTAGTS